MREIKFRSWNGDMLSEPFAPWELVDTGCEGMMTKSGVSVFWGGYPQNWMQFTGLYDINGKEIYEGDILDDHSMYPLPVVWDTESTGFVRKDYDDDFYITANCAVVGNIYENPELLGVK